MTVAQLDILATASIARTAPREEEGTLADLLSFSRMELPSG